MPAYTRWWEEEEGLYSQPPQDGGRKRKAYIATYTRYKEGGRGRLI